MTDPTDPRQRPPNIRLAIRLAVLALLLFIGAVLWAANEGWF